jgi:hypothetical protein
MSRRGRQGHYTSTRSRLLCEPYFRGTREWQCRMTPLPSSRYVLSSEAGFTTESDPNHQKRQLRIDTDGGVTTRARPLAVERLI